MTQRRRLPATSAAGRDTGAATRSSPVAAAAREQWRAALLVLPLFAVPARDLHRADRLDALRARRRQRRRADPAARGGGVAGLGRPRIAARRPRSPRWSTIFARRAKAGTLASAATRLNYDDRRLPHAARHERPARRRRRPATGRGTRCSTSIRNGATRDMGRDPPRAGGPVTDFYLLAALDLRRDADNAIARGAGRTSRSFATCSAARCGSRRGHARVPGCSATRSPTSLRLPPQTRSLLLFLVLLPFWTSLLVRTVAWVVLLQREGILNNLLLSLGIDPRAVADDLQPLRRLRRDGARAAAVHGAAALRVMKGDPADVRARGGLARRDAVHRVPPRLPAADAARHRRGLPDGVHPGARLLHHAGAGRRRRRPDDQLLHRVLTQARRSTGAWRRRCRSCCSPRRWRCTPSTTGWSGSTSCGWAEPSARPRRRMPRRLSALAHATLWR